MGETGGIGRSLTDVRSYLHVLRLAHFYSYAHVRQARRLTRGRELSMSPNVSLRNAERISIGERSHIGEYCDLWAGDASGRIVIGADCLLAPRVMITASDYGTARGIPPAEQPKAERDVVVGDGVWLGANVVVTAGVTIGAGAIVGAGAVVTRDLPENCIAGGVPAKVIGWRQPATEGAPELFEQGGR